MSNYLDSELPWRVVWELLVTLSCAEPCLSYTPPRCGALGALLLRCRSWASTPHMKQLNSRGFIRSIDIHCDKLYDTFWHITTHDSCFIFGIAPVWHHKHREPSMGTAAMLGRWNGTGPMPKICLLLEVSLPRLMQPHGRRWPADCTTAAHNPKSGRVEVSRVLQI